MTYLRSATGSPSRAALIGRLILRALAEGETDATKLAEFARGRLRRKGVELRRSLEGLAHEVATLRPLGVALPARRGGGGHPPRQRADRRGGRGGRRPIRGFCC